MGVIKFLETNCRNCYSCVRACEVNAIRVKNEQAEVVEERCIACGRCIKACHSNAKEIATDIQKVKSLLKRKEKVAVSIAPSFVAAFGKLSNKLSGALRYLGFSYIEETAIGAEFVNKEYEKYIETLDGTCYITSSCAAVNELVEKYYPEIISSLIPVISPMICHKRLMVEKYGEDTKVVFIGPCIAKKNEAKEEGNIDAVITFDELVNWFIEEQINLESFEEVPFDAISTTERRYPTVGGVTFNMDKDKIPRQIIHVDGIKECIDALNRIKQGAFKDGFIEMNLCRHGCIDGPAMPENGLSPYERLQIIKDYANICEKTNDVSNGYTKDFNIDMERRFISKFKPLKEPSEKEIKEILSRIGKNTLKDELNCGSCGYRTCRDKAIAVYNGLAEPTMCLPFMKQKAENLSNVIFDMTPTIIMVIDENLRIIDYNAAAEKFFKVKKNIAIGLDIELLIPTDIIKEFLQSEQDIISKKAYLENKDATVLESVIAVENSNATLVILNDFTDTLKQEESLRQMRINAIEMAQQVIDKQMTVAQEIASLLGETTAETKVSLTKLKRVVQGEEVDLK